MRSDKLKEELAKAKLKAAEWQAKVKDLERRIIEQENTEIVQAVRSINATPEELRETLEQIRSMRKPPAEKGAEERERQAGGEASRNPAGTGEKKETEHQNPEGEEGKTE